MDKLLGDLAEVVRLRDAGFDYAHVSRKAYDCVLTHHAEIAEAVMDARRYRWLRDHSYGQADHPICFAQQPRSINGERSGTLYVGPLFGDVLDRDIDTAIDAQHNSALEG